MNNVYIGIKIFISILICKKILETWLERRNILHISKNRSKVPHEFESAISLADHQKAADYTNTKTNTSQLFEIFNFALFLCWTIFGGIELLHQSVTTLGQSSLITGVIFFAIFFFINGIFSLPQSLYFTFVIEEKFGFNKTTPRLFLVDLCKAVMLSILIGTPILFGILWIMEFLGSTWWIWAFIFLTLIQLTLVWIYPRIISPIFNKFSPLPDGDIKNKVLALLKKTGFTSNGIFIMDASKRSSHGNAYFTGLGKNKRIVFFDTLIKSLSSSEVEAVLAHELGHFKKKHILKGLLLALTMSFIGFFILGLMINWSPFFMAHGVQSMTTYTGLILFMLVSSTYTFFLTPITTYLSRKNEFEADDFASEFSCPKSLISALIKMYKDNASSLTPDPIYSAFYHSHPRALVRVENLRKQSVD